MIMISKKVITLILFVLFGVISIPTNAEIINVETNGYGSTQKLAIAEGLKEAISQVYGISMESSDFVSLASRSAEVTKNDQTSNLEAFDKRSQSNIYSHVKGYISKYSIISSELDEEGAYKVTLNVTIDKYTAPGQSNNRRGIAVLGFKAKDSQIFNGRLSATEQVSSVTDALVASFTSTRKFSVLDRDNDDVYQLEKTLIASDDVDAKELQKFGNVKGTDYIVTGSIKNITINSTKQKIELSGDTFVTKSASVMVDYRLISFATRQVVYSSSVRIVLNNSEVSSLNSVEIVAKLMNKASLKIVDACIEAIYPPQVVSVSGKNIYINVGGDNITKGTDYAVYELGDDIIDPYTGESLGAEETYIATIKIADVKPKYSVGRIVEGDIKSIEKNQICRKKEPEPKKQGKTKTKNVLENLDNEW